MSNNARRKLYVGIDYGTTFSGIAYALPTVSDGKDVEVVTSWPGQQGANNDLFEKVPSRIAYARQDPPESDANGTVGPLWGYEVKASPSFVSYSWTKLLLDQQTHRSDYESSGSDELGGTEDAGLLRLPQGKTAVTVVTDYLRHLYLHCMMTLEKRYDEFLGVSPIEFWFTMPAIWSDQAQSATRYAAKKAGFGSRPFDSIHMITEPEAGVLAAMKTQVEVTKEALEPGSGLLVVDCGGGTVDLTSYVIVSLAPRLELRETSPGIGKKCGATFIDRNFYKLMCRRFGTVFSSRPMDKIGPGSKFMEDFQRIKHNFSLEHRSSESIVLKMPDLDKNATHPSLYNFEEDEILLSSQDIQQCFDPIIEQIMGLIKQQISDAELNGHPKVQTIILLGGFGSSDYLWKTVRAWGKDNGIKSTIVPKNPWSAIARGAALRGLEGSKIPVTKCRRHYGYTYDRPFDAFKDDSEDSTFEDEKGVKKVRHCMEWIFNKNEEIVHNSEPKSLKFVQHYSPLSGKKWIDFKIYSCNLSRAPDKRNTQVSHLGSVQVSVEDVPLNQCESYRKRGLRYYRIDFTCFVKLGSDKGVMEVTVEWRGKKCGSGRLSFEDS